MELQRKVSLFTSVRGIAVTLLLLLVALDSIASYYLWKYCGMIENNPIMLWALQIGWVYWLFKLIQTFLVGIICYLYSKNKVARFATGILIVVFSFVWLQFLIGTVQGALS